MIGGEDHVFPYAGSPVEGMRVAVRAVLRKWPHALFENAADGSVWDAYHKLPLSVPEFLVYRDANAYALWEKEGAVPPTCNTMVHLLANSESLTVVVDDGSQGEMKALLEAIGASLKMDLFLMARSAA